MGDTKISAFTGAQLAALRSAAWGAG